MTRQVRITYGGDELTVMPVLNRPDEPASLAAVEALLQLRFEVQDVETGLHPAGALTGGEVAAELMARAVIHQEMQRREDRR